jgi:hypothetical protein
MEKVLEHIKLRPRMHLIDPSLENLYILIRGYMYQLHQEEDIIPEFYPGFQEYIEKVYGVTTGQHWSKIIIFHSENKNESLERFFRHLEEYTEIDRRSPQ